MDNKAILEKVFEYMTKADEKTNSHMRFTNWEWPTGVGVYGMFKFYQKTGDKSYFDFLVNWVEGHIKTGLPPKNVNSVAPFLTLAHIYEITKNEKYLKLCTEWANWIISDMPRTTEGGLQHITIMDDNFEQIWDDTLFMTVLFLAKMGEMTNNKVYKEEAEYQFLVHIKYLADKYSGLWCHGFSFEGRHDFGNIHWARGNSWYTSAVVEFLEISKVEGSIKRFLIETLISQVEAFSKYQTDDGFWRTIIDDEESYKETSATAGIAYGILKAVRLGYIDAKYEEIGKKAVNAVIPQIAENGEVNGVSFGTAIGNTKKHYMDIKIAPTAYGEALALMMMTEII